MMLKFTNARQMFVHLRRFWSYMNEGPQKEWDRVYLCSVAPMSAGALRQNEEAARGQH